MIAGQKHREAFDAVLPFLPQAQDQGLERGRDAMGADAGTAAIFAGARAPELSVPRHPEVKLAAEIPKNRQARLTLRVTCW